MKYKAEATEPPPSAELPNRFVPQLGVSISINPECLNISIIDPFFNRASDHLILAAPTIERRVRTSWGSVGTLVIRPKKAGVMGFVFILGTNLRAV